MAKARDRHSIWLREVKRRTGAKSIEVTDGRGEQTLHLGCSHGHTVDFTLKSRAPSEFVAKQLMNAGWTVGNKLACPEHSQPKKKPAQPKKQEKTQMPPATSAPSPTDQARQAKRRAMDWLAESFTAATGRYAEGVSDATISKETGLSEANVKDLREEFYGVLQEPAEVEEARAKLKALKTKVEAAEKQCADLFSNLHEEVLAVRRSIVRIQEKNNW